MASELRPTSLTRVSLFRQPRGADGGGRQVPQGVSPLLRVPLRAGRQDGHPGQGEQALLQQGLRQVSRTCSVMADTLILIESRKGDNICLKFWYIYLPPIAEHFSLNQIKQ